MVSENLNFLISVQETGSALVARLRREITELGPAGSRSFKQLSLEAQAAQLQFAKLSMAVTAAQAKMNASGGLKFAFNI